MVLQDSLMKDFLIILTEGSEANSSGKVRAIARLGDELDAVLSSVVIRAWKLALMSLPKGQMFRTWSSVSTAGETAPTEEQKSQMRSCCWVLLYLPISMFNL